MILANNILLPFKFSCENVNLMKSDDLEIQYFLLLPVRVIKETEEMQGKR